VSKRLPGTIHDRFWAIPNVPDHCRSESMDGSSIDSNGYGTPHPTRPHSQALQRQLSLITGDKEADYFLFDDLDRPIRFVLYDNWEKMMFRILRAGPMFGSDTQGVEAIAEHLIKVMGNKPGLSRERILAQLNKEYEIDVKSMLLEFKRRGLENGLDPSETFLEMMSKNYETFIPGLASRAQLRR
jgi:hypothetical protein